MRHENRTHDAALLLARALVGGFELNAMYAALAMLLAVEDHGAFSIDQAVGIREKMHPVFGWIGVAGGIAAALAVLSRRVSSDGETAASPAEVGTVGAPASNSTPVTQ